HCDPMERFSVVSFVWMPGQRTPVHDHTVWGLVGVMRGEETCEEYSHDIKPAGRHPVRRGQVDRVSPRIGDIHVVANEGGEVAVSIHVYGANIGAVRRHTYDPASGAQRDFVSGYANASVPNLWDRSREA
ncbi:MAG: cysteine dioxygenase, partial [Burkholderiales bacterium]